MKSKRVSRAGTADDLRRKPRRRPVPRWLHKSQDLDAIARSRCLLVLSVLSGEKAVTEAIGEAKISRPGYYALETRALRAMLTALNPLGGVRDDGTPDLAAASCRIRELECKATKLEQDKRRAERLLLMTRKSLRRGPMPKLLRSIPTPRLRWRHWKTKGSPSAAASTATPGGAAAS
jgi:hypothetical protein